MIGVWDYFMRRKGLLGLFLGFFLLGGMLSYQALRSSAVESEAAPVEYIHIDTIGKTASDESAPEASETDIPVPNTGGEFATNFPVILGILQPSEVIALAPAADELQEPALPADTNASVQQTIDLATVTTSPEDTSATESSEAKLSVGYLAFLTFAGMVVAAFGVYLTEQHFLR